MLAGLACAAVTGTLLGRHLWRLAFPAQAPRFDDAWINRFSLDRYRPMRRLLAETDFEFLGREGRVSPKIAKNLRAARRRIFRVYLSDLSRDFYRLHGAAKLMLLQAREDQPDLAAILVRQRVVFAFAMLAVEYRLLLHAVGLNSVDVSRLMGVVEGLRFQVVRPAELV